MQNKKTIILIVLSIGALISLIYGITARPRTKGKVLPRNVVTSAVETIPQVRRIIPTKRRAKKTDYLSWGRNPFAAREVTVKVAPQLTLSGIMWDEENPKAIINNNMVGIGDKVGPNTVVDIKKDRVILNDGTADFELRLGW